MMFWNWHGLASNSGDAQHSIAPVCPAVQRVLKVALECFAGRERYANHNLDGCLIC